MELRRIALGNSGAFEHFIFGHQSLMWIILLMGAIQKSSLEKREEITASKAA